MTSIKDTIGRRARTRPCSTGKCLRLTKRDLIWLSALHRHGPLPTSFLLEYTAHLNMYRKRELERLGDLFHEDQTAHSGSYLIRPVQQFQTLDSRFNQIVHDVSPASKRALQELGTWNESAGPQGGPWWHRLMISTITASIEISTLTRSDLNFIPQSSILKRASARLDCPVRYKDPNSNRIIERSLRPDAIFGLEHKSSEGPRYRFFALEADRATEPLSAASSSRKSIARSFLQYRAYVENEIFRRHLKLTSPLLVLNVTSSEAREKALVRTLERTVPQGNNYMLFRHWVSYRAPPRPPVPNAAFLKGDWTRLRRPSVRIDRYKVC